jgi:hypothetical protein
LIEFLLKKKLHPSSGDGAFCSPHFIPPMRFHGTRFCLREKPGKQLLLVGIYRIGKKMSRGKAEKA